MRQEFDPSAKAREIHLAREERERGPPIRALFHLGPGDRAVRGNIEPDVISIRDEKLLFRNFVLPPHAARTAEENMPGFHLGSPSPLAVALQKRRAQRPGGLVARFDSLNQNLRPVSREAEFWRRQEDEDKKTQHTHRV